MNKITRTFVLALVAITFMASPGMAQRKKNKEAAATAPVETTVSTPVAAGNSSEYETQRKVFDLALKYSDGQAAKNPLLTMMVLKPEDKTLRDTLALLYFNLGSYGETIMVSREILAENPNKLEILEVKAISQKNLGLLREAQTDLETIYLKTQDIAYLYEISALQYQMKNYRECLVSLDILLGSKDSDKETVSLPVNQVSQQQVPLKAAVLNMKGIIASENNDLQSAKDHYKKALEIYPGFVLAKANLSMIEKNAPAKKPAAAPAKK